MTQKWHQTWHSTVSLIMFFPVRFITLVVLCIALNSPHQPDSCRNKAHPLLDSSMLQFVGHLKKRTMSIMTFLTIDDILNGYCSLNLIHSKEWSGSKGMWQMLCGSLLIYLIDWQKLPPSSHHNIYPQLSLSVCHHSYPHGHYRLQCNIHAGSVHNCLFTFPFVNLIILTKRVQKAHFENSKFILE